MLRLPRNSSWESHHRWKSTFTDAYDFVYCADKDLDEILERIGYLSMLQILNVYSSWSPRVLKLNTSVLWLIESCEGWILTPRDIQQLFRTWTKQSCWWNEQTGKLKTAHSFIENQKGEFRSGSIRFWGKKGNDSSDQLLQNDYCQEIIHSIDKTHAKNI